MTSGTVVPLKVEDLVVHYHTRRGPVKAVDGVSFELQKGERLGLVGESGSGKSTIALSLIVAHKEPARIESGRILLNGVDMLTLSEAEVRQKRLSEIAMVPQGALNSLNPVMRVSNQIMDGLSDHGIRKSSNESRDFVAELLGRVGLQPDVARMFPHELSGGMKQRVTIALSISMNPSVIIADEPTSALDVVVQRQIVQTLREVQEGLGAATILIGHDMGLMAQFATRIGIMYAGRLVEIGPTRAIFNNPKHPYTQLLISSLPNTNGKRRLTGIPGITPSLLKPPSGCVFHTRCPKVFDRCSMELPQLTGGDDGRQQACHLYTEEVTSPEKEVLA
ncbi:MAG: ABC transporter ATP-binding protein [Chloroflexi bacterium]|nr:ABC transporter ATP-binding protein [Chloroflexota bacterium]